MLIIKPAENKEDTVIVDLLNQSMPSEFKSGIELEQLAHLLTLEGVEIDGFIGSFKVTKEVLEQQVSEGFTGRLKTVQKVVGTEETTNEEGETIKVDITEPEEVVKTWGEYASCFEDDTHAYIRIGAVDEHGNKKREATHAELVQWIECFGFDNLLTKSMTTDAIPLINDLN